MLAAAFAAALLLTPPDAVANQTPLPMAQDPAASGPVALEDIVVQGRRLEDTTEQFVREVGAPSRGRGLARWRGGVCTGVANLTPEVAQYLSDRVSSRARELGLTAGDPGCNPSILIIAVADANAFTPEFVAMRPRLFRVGGAGMDRGANALNAFKTSDRPVRWWHVSVPVDETGQVAVRIPGYCSGACTEPHEMAPKVEVLSSRLLSNTQDDLKRAFVIVDVDKIGEISLDQLGDYIAMVALAQIDPEGDTGGYSTILNVFDNPQDTPALTSWDKAYLTGLYESDRTRANPRAARMEVVASIVDARRSMPREDEDAAQ